MDWGGRGARGVAGSGWCLALAALACLACASTLVLERGRWRHVVLGYSIDAPAAPDWVPVGLEQGDLAFRGPDRAALSLSSRCHTPLAEPRVLARHLLIGQPERSRLEARAVRVDGSPAWLQRYELRVPGGKRLLTSVTAVIRSCVIDFVLVEAAASERSQAEFERWWGSFRWPTAQEATS